MCANFPVCVPRVFAIFGPFTSQKHRKRSPKCPQIDEKWAQNMWKNRKMTPKITPKLNNKIWKTKWRVDRILLYHNPSIHQSITPSMHQTHHSTKRYIPVQWSREGRTQIMVPAHVGPAHIYPAHMGPAQHTRHRSYGYKTNQGFIRRQDCNTSQDK